MRAFEIRLQMNELERPFLEYSAGRCVNLLKMSQYPEILREWIRLRRLIEK